MQTLGAEKLTQLEETYEKINKTLTDLNEPEKTILEAREILGEPANSLTDNQIRDLINETQYLVDTWLEEFERSIFDGKTLYELFRL